MMNIWWCLKIGVKALKNLLNIHQFRFPYFIFKIQIEDFYHFSEFFPLFFFGLWVGVVFLNTFRDPSKYFEAPTKTHHPPVPPGFTEPAFPIRPIRRSQIVLVHHALTWWCWVTRCQMEGPLPHTIHGHGIFVYMNGWFLWSDECR